MSRFRPHPPLHSSCSTRTLLPRGEAYPASPHPLLVSLEPTRRCCPLRPDRVFFLPPAANHTILALGLQEDGDAGHQVKSRKCGGVIVPLLVAMYEVRQSIVRAIFGSVLRACRPSARLSRDAYGLAVAKVPTSSWHRNIGG